MTIILRATVNPFFRLVEPVPPSLADCERLVLRVPAPEAPIADWLAHQLDESQWVIEATPLGGRAIRYAEPTERAPDGSTDAWLGLLREVGDRLDVVPIRLLPLDERATEVTILCHWPLAWPLLASIVRRAKGTWAGTTTTPPLDELEQPTARTEGSESRGTERRPWEAICGGRDREMVRMWWEGFTQGEIAQQYRVQTKTVDNRFCLLRSSYGHDVVPTKEELQRMRRKPG